MGVEERVVSDIGRGIANARRSAGLTQLQMAAKAGVTVKDISRIENGNPGVSWGKVVRVMNQLDQPLPRGAQVTRPPSFKAVDRAVKKRSASRDGSTASMQRMPSARRPSAG